MVRGIAVAGPMLIVAILEAASLVLTGAGRSPWWPDYQLNLSEATAVRDDAEVARLLERGEDPNRRRTVRAGLLGNERVVTATPLEAALSIRRAELLGGLFARGASIPPEDLPRIRCAVRALDDAEISAALDARYPPADAPTCSGEEQLWLPAPR